jgi:acyl-CoA thioester hydrolase
MTYTSPPYRIYVYDTDVAGVVHHSNYLRYFEAGRIEYLRHLGQPYLEFQRQGMGFVPINIDITYLKPLRQDDQFVVKTSLFKFKKASFILDQFIASDTGTHAHGKVTLACVAEPEFKPRRLPSELIRALNGS